MTCKQIFWARERSEFANRHSSAHPLSASLSTISLLALLPLFHFSPLCLVMGYQYHIPDTTKQHIYAQAALINRISLPRGSGFLPGLYVLGWYNCMWAITNLVPNQLKISHYLTSLIQHTPDIYLSELQQQLEVAWGVLVHKSTITQSLHYVGYSMKKVSVSALEQNEGLHSQRLQTMGLGFSAE